MQTVHDQHAQPVLAPVDQEGTKAIVRAWLKPSGASVRKDEPIVELETDKVLVEVCAPCDGTLEIVIPENADATPGSVLGHIRADDAREASSEPAPASPEQRPAALEHRLASDATQRLSPSVRKLVAETSIDPSSVEGTGRGGRLTRADVVRALEQRDTQQPTDREREAVREAVRNAAAQSQHASVRVPHSAMRRRIAEHMQQSVSTAPHVTAVFQADFSSIIAHRKKHKDAFAANGVHLTYTAYFIAASVEAMRAVPEVNSRWHDDYLEVFGDINIGVGASLGDKGLIVPVIHQVQDLSLLGIASRLQRATEAARSGKLKPADVQGGTFTISNHGVSGSLVAAPIIINQPQCAILGIGALEKRVVVREVNGNDTLQILPCAYVSLTIDHRALDGTQTNAWLTRFVDVLEHWPIDSAM
ncbi:Dihydrolipoamide acetyltransferase component of pyruvate dehydrogenase complex [Pararobbsia alpina]|uniref:dihydrolipoamide acetyltransferase family protein n=1 Tax=Pararobbsia alpina TaxID=621374 RepID=UPI0039A61374